MKNRGFTLLEVLIALTLLSLMVVLLFASLTIAANSWHKGENKLAQVNKIAVTYQFLNNYLTTALPLTSEQLKETGEIKAPLVFQGNQHTLQFVSVTRLGLQLFRIHQQNDSLKVTLRPFFSSQTETEQVILLTGVRDFKIEYFGADNDINPALWHSEWLKKTMQPQLIKVSIQLENEQFIPDWFFALKMPKQNFALQAITPK